MKFSIVLVALLTCGASTEAAKRKPYVPAAWLSAQQNKTNARVFSTQSLIVFIDMSGLTASEGEWGALHNFADATKRYSQATRFVAQWDTYMPDSHEFERWMYDRNQQAVFYQSRRWDLFGRNKSWGGMCVIEPVGVTDEMIWHAASQRHNGVFDLLRYGAINRRVYWKKRWVLLLKTDPRIQPRKGLLFSPEPKRNNY